MPGSKSPGERSPDGSWRSMSRWQKWCCEPVPVIRVEAWLRMLGAVEDAGVGVACGRGLICIDIDQEYLLDPVLAILPDPRCRRKGARASLCSIAATPRRLGRATIALKNGSAYRGSKMFSRASNKVPTNQSINEVLRRNRVAGSVVSYDSLYRKRSAGH